MKPKTTVHTQGPSGWFGEFLESSNASHIKGVGFYPAFSNVTVIGRPYYLQDQVDARVREGMDGADEMFEAILPEVEANPQVDIWETPANEPSIWDPSVATNFRSFSQRMIFRFHMLRKKIIVGSINTGWPRLPHEDGGAMMSMLLLACQGADGVSFHEYDPVDMRTGGGYTCLRYRYFHQYCLDINYDHPPIYITECGMDRTDPPGPDFGHAGWIEVLQGAEDPVGRFIEQILWYESELQKDDYVMCATYFTAAPSGWWSFDMHQELCMRLAPLLKAVEPEPPPVHYCPPIDDMAKGFFVSEFQGNLDFDAVRDAGYSYVHIRASCGLYKDPTFERNWAKAGQAGLLRSVWHFLEQEPVGQASFFKSIVGDREPELGIFGDFENVKDMPPLSRGKADAFLVAADRNFNTTCDVYSSPGWLNTHGGYDAWEARGRELWLAYWTDGATWLLPDGAHYHIFWQWKCTAPFGPFPKRVCLDRYAGTREQLFIEHGIDPPDQGESDMWFKDNAGEFITEEEFRWALNPETGNMDSFGRGYEVQKMLDGAEWVVDGMQTQLEGPPLQWVRVWKTHSAVQPPDLGWGFPDPDHPAEELQVWFKDKGSYWEAEHDCSNRYYPDRPEGEDGYQGPYFNYIDGDMVLGCGFIAGTGYKTAIIYYKPSGTVEPEPPGPEDGVTYRDAGSNIISKSRFHELMGDAHIKHVEDLQEGEEYLKIVELWIREVPKPRFASLMVHKADGPMADVPFKFFHEGTVLLESVTNASGTGKLEIGSRDAYAVPGKGPLNLRIRTTYTMRAEQMRDYGMVRITDALNRHCDVVYEPVVHGEAEPPDPDPDPLPDDIMEALEQLNEDHVDLAKGQDELKAHFDGRLDTISAAIGELAGQIQLHLVEIERLLKKIAGE